MITTSVNIIPETSIDDVVSIATHAESLGFDRCWVYDEGLATRDVYVALCAIAGSTSTLNLGPGVTNPYTRQPGQTAVAIASLDELSVGRAFLGIGAGGSLTLDPLGIVRTRPLAAVRETIEACRRLWSGETIDLDGAHVRLRQARLGFGRREIEIWLAGRGPKMLRLGGEVADGVMLDFIHKPSLPEYVARVAEGGDARICYSTAIVSSDEDLDFVRPHMTYRLVDSPPSVKEALGIGEEHIALIADSLRGGIQEAAQHVRDDWILPFIVQDSTQLGDLVDRHGFEEFLVPMFDMPDPHAYLGRVAAILGDL